MKFNRTNLLYFSPTKTTKQILQSVALGLSKEIRYFDLTYPMVDDISFSDELVIIGAPVYAGRLPVVAVERFEQIKAKNSLAILVVVYGNRDFEDALLELKHLSIKLGFTPIAGATFIGEHSYSNAEFPVAQDRPDRQDKMMANEFAKKIKSKLKALHVRKNELKVPGNFPYKAPMPIKILAPISDENLCSICGECVDVCPTEAIYIDDGLQTVKELCIRCCACVKICSHEARVFENEAMKPIAIKLSTNCAQRKEPQFFL